MVIGVLAIQGAVSEHLSHLEQCHVEAAAVKKPADLDSVTGLIIPGGESTTIGKLINQFGLLEPIIERSKEKSMAVFGTCAGMVLLAKEVLDGFAEQPGLALMDIRVRRNAFGRQRESFETELSFGSFELPLTAVFIRAPIIEEAGGDIQILAEIMEGIVAARQNNLLVTSFHPELDRDLRVHQYFIQMCREL